MRKIVCVILAFVMLFGFLPSSPVEVQASGKKFNVSAKKMKEAINNYSVAVTVDNKEQRFVVKSPEIVKFTVKSKKYSADQTMMTVKANAYINREVATVKANVTLKYKLKKNKWKVSSVKFGKASISSIALKGTWTGTYVANQGQTRAEFIVNDVSKDGYASGIFNFSAVPTNPTVPSGSYTVNGGFDKATGKVTFVGNQWINQPSGYTIVDFYGYVDLKEKAIRSDDYSLYIKKVS